MNFLRSTFLLIAFIGLGTMLNAQVPEGGIQLNATTGTTYQNLGRGTLTEVPIEGQTFTQALQLAIGSNVSNPWDASIRFPAAAGIESGDVLLVAFYARTIVSPEETGEGRLTVVIEHNVTYDKEISYNITIGNEWKQYYASAISGASLTSGTVSYLFQCGFPNQTIEVADVQFLNYKQTLGLDDLPVTEITYIGQAPDAGWRAPANERISQIRKGVVDITVIDETGVALDGADVTIEMVQHKFGFGTAIAASEFNNNATYRNKVLEMFNEVVFENDLKWPQFNPSNTAAISRAMDTLDAHKIPIRGHNIIWPSWRFTPSYLEGLKDDPVALRNAINNHFREVTTFTKGRLNDWDVMNEPYSEHDVQDILGNEVMAEWYKLARQYDRNVKLYVNDYSIISSAGSNITKQNYYYDLIQQIEADGGEINGIGFQGHMSTELTSITKVYDILERFSTLGKDLKITEHDIDITQRNVQADYTRDFMTIVFSQASVKSLMVWGFWAGRHWKPESAFFESDWTARPHGDVWNDLIYNQWWTPKTDLVTDMHGESSLEGFLGTYNYTVSKDGIERSGYFTIDNSNQSGLPNKVLISLDPAVPEAVSITSSIEGFLCEGESTILSAPTGDGLTYSWFKDDVDLSENASSISANEAGNYVVKVSKSGVELTSEPFTLVVKASPISEITPTGNVTLCEGEYLSLMATEAEGLDYYWKKNGQQVNSGISALEITNSGTYTLQTAAGGCTSVSESAVVSVGTKPDAVITVTGDLPMCEGESVYLLGTIANNIDYSWFKDGADMNEANRLIEVFESGSYAVQTSIGDCSTLSEAVVVDVNPVPEASITADGELSFCEGSSVLLNANEGEGLIYTWMIGSTVLDETDQSLSAEESGSYSLMTTLANCSATSDPVIVSVLSATDPACINNILEKESFSSVYPNPFKGSFMLKLAPGNTATNVELVNVLGEKVFSRKLSTPSNELKIDVRSPGIYFLRINNGTRLETIKVTGE